MYKRQAPYIRKTPTLPYTRTRGSDFGGDVTLKLELLQAAGSFKARGAMNRLLTPVSYTHLDVYKRQ